MKKLATIVALVFAFLNSYSQAIVYRNGKPIAKGIVQSTNNKMLYLRVYEYNKLSTKLFFKASIEKLVLEDSVSVALYQADPYDYPTVVLIDIKRSDYNLFEKKLNAPENVLSASDTEINTIDLSPRIKNKNEILNKRMVLAEKHVGNASTSMLMSFVIGLGGTLIVSNMANGATTTGQIRDAAVASIVVGGISFGFFANALIQNTKASTLLKMQ